jgi:transaldolase
MTDPLRRLSNEDVAIWLDDMSRGRLVSGNLKALVRDKHVVGVTTNPTIFHKAIAGSHSTSPPPRPSAC